MTDNQHKEVKLDLGSPLGCGLAVIVFGFAIISLNAEFFTDLSNWKLYGEGYKETKTFWIHQFFNVPSIIIVFVGTITALVISQPLDRLKNIPIILSNVWKTENWSYMGIIDQMCGYADQARKKGTFSLDKQVQELPDGFLKKGRENGHLTTNGVMMFIYQAHQSFTMWHQIMPKIDDDTIKLIEND